jgi:predicted transcriptional regulator
MGKKKADLAKEIYNYIRQLSPRPVSTREISENVGIAWHTADRYCLKLQLAGKIAAYKIGKATAWYLLKS